MWKSLEAKSNAFRGSTPKQKPQDSKTVFQDELDVIKLDPLSPKAKIVRNKLRTMIVSDPVMFKNLQQELRAKNLSTNTFAVEILNRSMLEKIGITVLEGEAGGNARNDQNTILPQRSARVGPADEAERGDRSGALRNMLKNCGNMFGPTVKKGGINGTQETTEPVLGFGHTESPFASNIRRGSFGNDTQFINNPETGFNHGRRNSFDLADEMASSNLNAWRDPFSMDTIRTDTSSEEQKADTTVVGSKKNKRSVPCMLEGLPRQDSLRAVLSDGFEDSVFNEADKKEEDTSGDGFVGGGGGGGGGGMAFHAFFGDDDVPSKKEPEDEIVKNDKNPLSLSEKGNETSAGGGPSSTKAEVGKQNEASAVDPSKPKSTLRRRRSSSKLQEAAGEITKSFYDVNDDTSGGEESETNKPVQKEVPKVEKSSDHMQRAERQRSSDLDEGDSKKKGKAGKLNDGKDKLKDSLRGKWSKNKAEKGRSDKQKGEKSKSEKSKGERSRGDKSRSEKERSRSDKSHTGRSRTEKAPTQQMPGFDQQMPGFEQPDPDETDDAIRARRERPTLRKRNSAKLQGAAGCISRRFSDRDLCPSSDEE